MAHPSSSGRQTNQQGPASGSVVEFAAPDVGRAFDDEWRRWIAENLLVGATPESLFEVLKSSGFSPQDAAREINLALQSPYLRGAELLCNRLRKREWLLSIYRKVNRMHPQGAEIERR